MCIRDRYIMGLILPVVLTVILLYLGYILFIRKPTTVTGALGHQQQRATSATTRSSSVSKQQTPSEFILSKSYGGCKICVDAAAILGADDLKISQSGGTFLRELLEMKCEVFFYCQVHEASQAAVLDQLRPYASLGLVRDRVLFCTTVKAHEAFTRQLVPTLLVSTRYETVSTVARHIPFVLFISTTTSFEAPNALVAHTLASLEAS
eukprot:TRINITY_DN12741_c0_g1_i5.p1 TRINITY_DN12741_c0_g1~~TRINITY_DN12741_c0_g1_i5.p1  ORF type:complete len:207 (+),score=26.31 TRINITY_DN12741_c0_g1_i5:124-744(+)